LLKDVLCSAYCVDELTNPDPEGGKQLTMCDRAMQVPAFELHKTSPSLKNLALSEIGVLL